MVNDYLKHYGVPGMKWGVRKDKYGSNYDKDYHVKAGTKFDRVSSSNTEHKFRKGIDVKYVSHDPEHYLNPDYRFGNAPTKVIHYETTKDTVIAGRKALNQILKDIGSDTQIPRNSKLYSDSGKNDATIFTKDSETRRKLIQRASELGYGGFLDPIDTRNHPEMGMYGIKSSTIFTDDILKEVGRTPISEIKGR